MFPVRLPLRFAAFTRPSRALPAGAEFWRHPAVRAVAPVVAGLVGGAA